MRGNAQFFNCSILQAVNSITAPDVRYSLVLGCRVEVYGGVFSCNDIESALGVSFKNGALCAYYQYGGEVRV
ncbi:hypothetical protein D3C79_939290 [compost metagenome]